MTPTYEPWDLFGKSLHGGKYTLAERLPIHFALKMVNRLNKEAKDGFFHHFYLSRTDVAAPIAAILPGEEFGTTKSFLAWLVQIGVVQYKSGGRYLVGEENLRGSVAVAERFGTVDDNGIWHVSRLIYRTPVI